MKKTSLTVGFKKDLMLFGSGLLFLGHAPSSYVDL